MRKIQVVQTSKRSCRRCAKNKVCFVWRDVVTPVPLNTYEVMDRNVMVAIHNVIGYHCSQFEDTMSSVKELGKWISQET